MSLLDKTWWGWLRKNSLIMLVQGITAKSYRHSHSLEADSLSVLIWRCLKLFPTYQNLRYPTYRKSVCVEVLNRRISGRCLKQYWENLQRLQSQIWGRVDQNGLEHTCERTTLTWQVDPAFNLGDHHFVEYSRNMFIIPWIQKTFKCIRRDPWWTLSDTQKNGD